MIDLAKRQAIRFPYCSRSVGLGEGVRLSRLRNRAAIALRFCAWRTLPGAKLGDGEALGDGLGTGVGNGVEADVGVGVGVADGDV